MHGLLRSRSSRCGLLREANFRNYLRSQAFAPCSRCHGSLLTITAVHLIQFKSHRKYTVDEILESYLLETLFIRDFFL